MGRERERNSTSGSVSVGGSSSNSNSRSTKRSRDRVEPPPPPPATTTTTAGCMSGVLHLFDFHQFQFSLNQQLCFKPNSSFNQDKQEPPSSKSSSSSSKTISSSKGVEAPRNSLESEEEQTSPVTTSTTGLPAETVSSETTNKEDDFGFPIGIRVHTRVGESRDQLSSSESCDSPCTKTPTLVARLMGLDLLPESVQSPSSVSSCSSLHNRLLQNKSQLLHGFESRKPLKARPSSNYMENNEGVVRFDISGTRSLPDTPRISSARRSDVSDPRLSLQINKENVGLVNEEFDYLGRVSTKSRKREWKFEEEKSSQSPSHYARQIVKQVKESVSRRVGRDITNVVSPSNNGGAGSNTGRSKASDQGDENAAPIVLLKPKKSSRFHKVGEDSSPSKHSTVPSCSPRLKFLELKNNKPAAVSSTPQDYQIITLQSPKPISKPRQITPSRPPPPPPLLLPPLPPTPPPPPKPNVSSKPKSQKLPQHQTIEKCKKASCERFTQRKDITITRATAASKASLNVLPDKKCRKSPASKDLSISSPPVQPTPSPPSSVPSTPTSKYYSHHQLQSRPASNPSRTSAQLSCPSSPTSYNAANEHHQRPAVVLHPPLDDCAAGNSHTGTIEELRYISRILKCTGIDTNTPVSFTRWFSPSHPLDPSIFHHLENSFAATTATTGPLKHLSNRRLLFDLVDEILVDILRPYLNMKPWINNSMKNNNNNNNSKQMKGDQLLQHLWSEICNFPSANCQILQDIDALIEKDLPDGNMRMLPVFDEAETVAFEIERAVLNSLILELAASDMPRVFHG